jgi:hypothetical protein
MSHFDELLRLIYADQPDHVRSAGGPWAGVARTVERTMAVLEDGQRKLAEVWRSPAGTAYLAEMGRVVDAMRATSEAARHNDQVMSAVADALDARQKDFGVLSRAPIPADARERYARAIVQALDEDYHQAVANFRPVPEFDPRIEEEQPLVHSDKDASSSTVGAGSTSPRPSASGGTTSRRLPSWVPTQPGEQVGQTSRGGDGGGTGTATGVGSGPALQGVGNTPSAFPSSVSPWPGVDPPVGGTSPGAPGASAWDRQPSTWMTPGGPTGGVTQPVPGPRDPTGGSPNRGLAQPPRGGAGLISPEPGGSSGAAISGRSGAAGHGPLVGGMPVGGFSSSSGRPWSGYRRRPEEFPTNRRHAVPPVIAPTTSVDEEESGLDQVSTDYVDDFGNRITIRRPRD